MRGVMAVVFDTGGVLVDWNPRHLCRKLFGDTAAMEDFLCRMCTPEWHGEADRGRRMAEGITACPLYALSNVPAEKFDEFEKVFDFIDAFNGILISGRPSTARRFRAEGGGNRVYRRYAGERRGGPEHWPSCHPLPVAGGAPG